MEFLAIGIVAFILVLFGIRGLVMISKIIGYFVLFIVAYVVIIHPIIRVISETGVLGFIVVMLFVFILGILIFSILTFVISKMLKISR